MRRDAVVASSFIVKKFQYGSYCAKMVLVNFAIAKWVANEPYIARRDRRIGRFYKSKRSILHCVASGKCKIETIVQAKTFKLIMFEASITFYKNNKFCRLTV